MTLAQDFEDFIKLLNKFDVEYMVVGGYAMAFHGKPRYTGDLDIWINISEANAEKLVQVIKAFGMASLGLEKEDFLQPGYVSQIGYPPLRIDILNSIDGVNFKEAFQNRQKIVEGDLEISYISLNDLVQNKVASGRKQDIQDVREIKKALPKQKPKPGKRKGPKS
ncbi:Predicted nucleotidyltransferase [Chitinophaga rupis]|uniref:Predicted nucleotidyltransferase n=1 Tax=Chitinophaga rupis TaxID=573321 RepID=A0A1H8F9S0_9BACT|nr:nucleotidyltransferase [Chitinophaga rupis]SEN28315.1 Predicted nucleotidyltransferase [Chitinophaga rupis]